MKRLLIQTQLSNYDTKGKFLLSCDSGWQMVLGRVRVMLRLRSDLDITVMCPMIDEGNEQCIPHPVDLNEDLWLKYGPDGENRLHYLGHRIIPNALVTRYDFDWTGLACNLDLGMQKIGQVPKWDVVYVNDPMHLRAFRAMFHVVGGYQPKFAVHSHFVDLPSCPKFPAEASLWMGQCEAARKADVNFWQCKSAMDQFFDEAIKDYQQPVIRDLMYKSFPWDDGYSVEEITSPINHSNVRFDTEWFKGYKKQGDVVIFVPNRIGGRGRSSDYTNCGKFLFEVLPELNKRNKNFIIVAGNPSQKFSNKELEHELGRYGYVDLVPDSLNRDEYKFVARHSDIVVGLYDQDTYGGTASRECIELGCMPLWLDCNEYSSLAREAEVDQLVLAHNFGDLVDVAESLIQTVVVNASERASLDEACSRLQSVVRGRCSYEQTTPDALRRMGL